MKEKNGFFKKHKKLIIFLIIVLVIVVAIASAINSGKEKVKNAILESSYSIILEKKDLANSVNVLGTLKAVDSASVVYTGGGLNSANKVIDVYFEQGDYVNEGDLVVQMDDSDAKDNLNVTYSGITVSNFNNERADVVASRNLANAERDYEEHYVEYGKKMEELYLAMINLEDVNNHKEEDPARYSEEWDWVMSEYRNWGVTKRGDIDAVKKAYENARAQFEMLSTNLTDAQYAWEIANASSKQAATSNNVSVKAGKKQVEDAAVTAPISGYITKLNVQAGDAYSASSGALFTISDLSGYEVETNIEQYDITSIEEGMKCIVKFDSVSDKEYTGHVSYVAVTPLETGSVAGMQAQASTKVIYPIKVTLDDPDDKLRVGMTSKVKLIIEERKNVFSVPYNCVREDENGENQYIVVLRTADDGTTSTEDIPVKTGLETDYYVEIEGSALEEGMTIIPKESNQDYLDLLEMIESDF